MSIRNVLIKENETPCFDQQATPEFLLIKQHEITRDHEPSEVVFCRISRLIVALSRAVSIFDDLQHLFKIFWPVQPLVAGPTKPRGKVLKHQH